VEYHYGRWADRVHPEDLPRVQETARRCIQEHTLLEVQYRIIWPDGSLHWVETKGVCLLDSHGKADRVIGVVTDITDRKAAEEELRRSRDELERIVLERTAALAETNRELQMEIQERMAAEEQLITSLEATHDLYENAPCGYHSLDADGVIVRINDTELRWLGYRRDEVIGKAKFSELLTPESRRAFQKSFSLLKEDGQVNDLVFEMVRKDGSILPVLLNASAVTDPDGNYVMSRSTVFDITERRKAEKEALHSAHLASIGELAAGVAHEINNPVNAVINYAQILVNKGDKQRKEYEFAGEIVKEGGRIATIVSSLLSFSRKSGDELLLVRMDEMLNAALTLMATQLQKDGIALKVTLPGGLPEIMAVPQQIQQVLLNLISNARYALNKKQQGPDSRKALEIRCDTEQKANGLMMRITFWDNGIGIPADILEKVTDAFFTTKPAKEGTGLGLSICSNIVMRHGGSLTISSEEGHYTEVAIVLPTAGRDTA
jgi:PAS domain S-box-containing protein